MSDEREGAPADGGSTADGADSSAAESGSGTQSAIAAPARPTGKRARRRALDTEPEADQDTDAADETDDDAEVAESDEGAAEDSKAAKAGKTKKDGKAGKAGKSRSAKAKERSGGGIFAPFKFVWNYLAQVIAELRKVIWPNRKQMISYTSVVLAFLVFMVALIGVVDLGLGKLVLMVFG